MVTRKTGTFRVPADEVQGEGSYVVLRTVSYGTLLKAKKGDLKDDWVLKKHVLEWDFVNDEDIPLPQVPDEPNIVYELTIPEKDFLIDALLVGPSTEKKNGDKMKLV